MINTFFDNLILRTLQRPQSQLTFFCPTLSTLSCNRHFMLLVFPWAEFSYRGRQLLSGSLSTQNYRKSPRQLRLLRSFCQAADVFPLGSCLDPTQQTIQHPLAFVLVARPKTYWLSASVAAGTKKRAGLPTKASLQMPSPDVLVLNPALCQQQKPGSKHGLAAHELWTCIADVWAMGAKLNLRRGHIRRQWLVASTRPELSRVCSVARGKGAFAKMHFMVLMRHNARTCCDRRSIHASARGSVLRYIRCAFKK